MRIGDARSQRKSPQDSSTKTTDSQNRPMPCVADRLQALDSLVDKAAAAVASGEESGGERERGNEGGEVTHISSCLVAQPD